LKEGKIGVTVFTRERDASRTDPISEKVNRDKCWVNVMFKHI